MAKTVPGPRILCVGGLKTGKPPALLKLGFDGMTTIFPSFPWFTQIRCTSLPLSTSTGRIGIVNNSHIHPRRVFARD